MGRKDDVTAVYFQDDERYADLINVHIFAGSPVVSADNIQEKDTRVQGFIRKCKERFQFVKYRDVVRKVVLGTTFAVIGLEHQSGVDYAMPVRVMLEDAAGYQEQLLQIKRTHRRRRDLKRSEFISGFSRTDRIAPVLTLVLYYGETPWSGPRDLYQMMDYDGVVHGMETFINHYPIHIIDVRNYPNTDRFQTDLREVFGFIQRSGNKEELKKYIAERKEQFQHIAEDAYDMMVSMTGSEELFQIQEDYKDEGGRIDMCKALLDWAAEERSEGRAEGRAAVAYNLYMRHMSLEDIAAICEVDVEQVRFWKNHWSDRV